MVTPFCQPRRLVRFAGKHVHRPTKFFYRGSCCLERTSTRPTLTAHQSPTVLIPAENSSVLTSLQHCMIPLRTVCWRVKLCNCNCNYRQFITEFLNEGLTKNSINMLLVKFRTVDRRLGSGSHSAHTDENVDTVESLLLSQEDKPQSHRTVREISREAGGSIDHQFRRLFTKICISSAARKGALNSCLKRTACTRYFQYAVWETMTW